MKCRRWLFAWLFAFILGGYDALNAQPSIPAGQVDVFMGVDFNYRDLFHNGRVYDLLINLTPGVKWNMGKGWQAAMQALVPVYNDYGDRYKKVRLNMAVLSKEAHWNRRWFLKVGGGLFGRERYGLDLKGMYVVNPWLALEAQAGLTGFCSMAVDWEASTPKRLTALAGANVYLTSWECSNPTATLSSPIQLTYDVDAEVAQSITAQKYVNGQWVDTEFTVEGGHVTVFADQFTSYTLLFGAEVTTVSSSTALAFNQDLWDNLYGSSEMTVGSASFSYRIGTEITSSGTNRLTAYLIEILARIAGAGVTTATGTYPINVTLPIGTALRVSGTQQVTTLTVSALNRSVSGRQYGDVAVVTTTYNRSHNGGSNQ